MMKQMFGSMSVRYPQPGHAKSQFHGQYVGIKIVDDLLDTFSERTEMTDHVAGIKNNTERSVSGHSKLEADFEEVNSFHVHNVFAGFFDTVREYAHFFAISSAQEIASATGLKKCFLLGPCRRRPAAGGFWNGHPGRISLLAFRIYSGRQSMFRRTYLHLHCSTRVSQPLWPSYSLGSY